MAKVSPLLKWLVVAAIVVAVPWTAALAGAYLAWRAGLLGRARGVLSAAMRRVGLSDAIFMWRIRGCAGMEERILDCRCYTVSSLAPFIATRSGSGCRLVSAIRVSDSSCSPENCRLAVAEALRYLRAASGEVCVSLSYRGADDQGATEGTIVFKADCGGNGAAQVDIRSRGIEAAERVSTACRMIEGLAPTLRAEALRGERIAASVAAGELSGR